MKRVLFGAGGVLAVLLVVFLAWFYRPWSDYSPAQVLKGRSAEDRTTYYRAMDEFFPNRDIAASPHVRELERDLRPLTIAYEYKGEARTLDDYAADHDITGLMLVKDGEVVFEKYWRGESAEDLHTSWSVAKSFIATMVGMGIKDGVIDSLDDPVEKYAPQFKGRDYGKISIRHLLMMSSGVDFIEDYEVVGSDVRKLFFNVFILNRDIDSFTRRYGQTRPAGEDFDYLSTNTIVLGAVIAGAYGENLSSIAERKIFAPMGMHEGNWLLDRNAKSGKELAYCCLNMRLEDFAKFGLFYLDGGVVDGEEMLPDGWIDFIRTPPQESHMPKGDRSTGQYGYGHHFWVPPQGEGAFFASGYNGQVIWMDPKANVVMAITGADRELPGANNELLPMMRAAVDAAAQVEAAEGSM